MDSLAGVTVWRPEQLQIVNNDQADAVLALDFPGPRADIGGGGRGGIVDIQGRSASVAAAAWSPGNSSAPTSPERSRSRSIPVAMLNNRRFNWCADISSEKKATG